MKSLLILVVLLIALSPVQAQDIPTKRICSNNPYREWNAPIRQAVTQFNRVVPTVLATTECDIIVYVVAELPCGSGYLGCTYAGYPSQVYVLATYSQRLTNLLHELMHAYGYWDHEPVEPSVTNPGFALMRCLTPFDIATLERLYGGHQIVLVLPFCCFLLR